MTFNFGKMTLHFGKPRKSGALTFHTKGGSPHGWRVGMWGIGHPAIGFVGYVSFVEKLKKDQG